MSEDLTEHLSRVDDTQVVWNHVENEDYEDGEDSLDILYPLFIIFPIHFNI